MGDVVFKQQSYHLPCLKGLRNAGSVEDLGQHRNKISSLLQQFERRFHVFDVFETEFNIFCSPFSVIPSDVPTDMQFEIIHLQCDSNLKEKLAYVGLKKHSSRSQLEISSCQNIVHVRNYLPTYVSKFSQQ